MPIPASGFNYEKDALADGALHYFPMFDLYTRSELYDILQGLRIDIVNDPEDTSKTSSGIIGYGVDITGNGTGSLHVSLVSDYSPTSTTVYDSWTVAIWVSFKNYSTTYITPILDITAVTGFKLYYQYNTSTAAMEFALGTTNSNIGTLLASLAPSTTAPQLYVVTSDAATNTVNVYVDNVLVLSSTASYLSLDPYSAPFYVGVSNTTSTSPEYVDGIVDELIFYNRALDSTDLGTLWNSGAGMELVMYANKHRELPVESIGVASSAMLSLSAVAASVLGLDTDVDTYNALTAVADAADALAGNDTGGVILVSSPSVSDGISESESLYESLATSFYVNEGYGYITGFSVNGESYVGVVMNTENSAITEYDGYTFNAVTNHNGVVFASDGSGILQLGSDADDGNSIQAYITTKLFSFERGPLKRVERAYLGLRNDQPVVLKVQYREENGDKVETWYELEDTSPTLREARIKLGKGMKSHYYQFSIANNAGGDFELDSIEFKPILLRRRV